MNEKLSPLNALTRSPSEPRRSRRAEATRRPKPEEKRQAPKGKARSRADR